MALKQHLGKVIQYSIALAFGLAILFYVFKNVDISALWKDILKTDIYLVLLSCLCGLFAYVARALRWKLMLESIGHLPSVGIVFHSISIGYITNLLLPRAGEVVRCTVLSKKTKLPVAELFGSVISERIIDLLVLFILMVFVIILKISFFGSFIVDNILHPLVTGFSFTNIIIGLIVLMILAFLSFLVLKKKKSLVDKIKLFGKQIGLGILSVLQLKNKLLFIVYTIAIWIFYWLMIWLVCLAIDATQFLTGIDALFLMVVGGVGMSVPVQGGIGVYHYFVAKALTLYGFTFEGVGLLLATISHESQVGFVIISGLISVIMVFLIKQIK